MKKYYLFIFILIVCHILILVLFGQPIISQTGKILLFWPYASGIENSQQLSDWYSPSHFIHGIIFFFLITYLLRYFVTFKGTHMSETSEGDFSSFEFKLFMATLVEVVWEILENSPIIINRYRQTGLAAGYFGDSVLNSVSDICFMIFGFWFAKKIGWKISLGIIILLELVTLYVIHDNLFLNIVMLIHPFSFINNWQMGL
jgi:hypothetical protein